MRDEWNSLADLLANMIEKYAADLNLDSLPDPIFPQDKAANDQADQTVYNENVETRKIA